MVPVCLPAWLWWCGPVAGRQVQEVPVEEEEEAAMDQHAARQQQQPHSEAEGGFRGPEPGMMARRPRQVDQGKGRGGVWVCVCFII